MDYQSFDDYWEPLLGGQGPFGSYVAGLPQGRRERIRAAVRAAYHCGRARRPAFARRHRLGRARARAVAPARQRRRSDWMLIERLPRVAGARPGFRARRNAAEPC